MASSISITVGATTATLPINGTNVQVSQALTRYARSLGIPVTGVAQTDLLAVLASVVDDVKRRSKAVQVTDADAVSHAANAAQAEQDNPL